MERTIVVTGKGSVRKAPDLVVLTLNVEARKRSYSQTMEEVSRQMKALEVAVESAGISATDLKTTRYAVQTFSESHTDAQGNYRQRFAGYHVVQGLRLEFDFQREMLTRVLTAIAKAPVTPELAVGFSVKDKAAVHRELLRSATRNARAQAEVLAEASGEQLGELLHIDYSLKEHHLHSRTSFEVQEKLLGVADTFTMPAMNPEDIQEEDTVRFHWGLR